MMLERPAAGKSGFHLRATALACALALACHSGTPPLRLGTTYTVQQSGALAVIESLWAAGGREEQRRTPLATVVGPSGQILRSAAQGDLDVVLTHAPSLEQRILVEPGHAALRCPLVESRFAIVGPVRDPARVAGAAGAAEAFRRIAAAGGPFVSRGDSSGTHVKELALWRAAGVRPAGPWYVESGADQATTLHVADERDAYALTDLPTFGKLAGLRMRVLFAADTALTNRYTLYVARPSRPAGAHAAAQAFVRWATDTARSRIADLVRLPDGSQAFVAPRAPAGACTTGPQ
jgi:tungstate transport system substrate-binding protein